LEKDGTPRPTKTYETRKVELSALAVKILRDHLAWLRAETECSGWAEPLWLFPSSQNTPLDYSRMADEYRATLKAAGLAGLGFTPYTMRHTFAALRLSAGAPPKWVSEQLGHKDLTTTLRFYDEWILKRGQTYADILEAKILACTAPVPVISEPESRTTPNGGLDWDSGLAELTGEKAGAGGESRTRDLLITKLAPQPTEPDQECCATCKHAEISTGLTRRAGKIEGTGAGAGYDPGRMFWFRWKRLVGSYLVFSTRSRG